MTLVDQIGTGEIAESLTLIYNLAILRKQP